MLGKRAKPRARTHKDVEIRYNDDGTVDEIVVKHPTDPKRCLLHLEQMDDGYYWIGLAPPDSEEFPVHVDLYSDKPISARVRV